MKYLNDSARVIQPTNIPEEDIVILFTKESNIEKSNSELSTGDDDVIEIIPNFVEET